MARRFESIGEKQIDFIKKQHIFFVASAGAQGLVGISPKGMDTFRVTGPNTVVWLNLTGSGNETATNVQENGRMTIMFCSFDDKPLVLRFYGNARVLHERDGDWGKYSEMFENYVGSRQIFVMDVSIVMESCGYAVPVMEFKAERHLLTDWAEKRGRDGVKKYWQENNAKSLDGRDTKIV